MSGDDKGKAEEKRPVTRCVNGHEVTSVKVRERNGQRFIYGYYYDSEKKRTITCYVGPADPDYVLRSMPAAFAVDPDVWALALTRTIARTANNLKAYRPEALRTLAKALALGLRDVLSVEPSLRGLVRKALADVYEGEEAPA